MAARQWILSFLLVAAISLLAGCSGGTTYSVSNPGSGNQSSVAIAFGQTPPATISLTPTTLPTVSASVSNDSTNSGVTWELVACQSNGSNCSAQPCSNVGVSIPNKACGYLYESSDPNKTFTLHSASGDVLTYQPPSTFPVPGDGMIIQIIALATVQPSSNVTAPISITAFGNVLQGTYVFHAQGSDSTVSTYPYQIAGVVYLDGNGNVTTPSGGTSAGQQTINTDNVNGTPVSTTSQITSGSYFVGTDGRGTLILNTTDGSGGAITELFSLAVISSSEASIAQISGTLTNSGGTTTLSQSGAGMLQLQDATATSTLPTAGYAFIASGTDSSSDPIVFGGILNIDGQGSKNNPCTGAGCISGNGSLADMDLSTNTGLITCTAGSAPFGMVSQSTGGAPGVVTFSLGNATNCFESNSVQFTGYIVDATHIQIIETDDNAGSGGFLTAGLAVSQGSATGTFSTFSGQYVWGVVGTDMNSGPIPSSLTSLGVVIADGSGNASGITDTLFQSSFSTGPPFGTLQFTGTYQLENGIGRARLGFIPEPKAHFNPDIIFYLTGSGTAPLVLYAAAGNTVYPALGTGIAYPQASNPQSIIFSGPYATSFNQSNGSENDGSGEMTATPPASGGTTGAITGTIDDFFNNYLLGPSAMPLVLNDTFTTPPDNFGRLAGTFLSPGPDNGPFVEYYLIDANSQGSANSGFFVETDAAVSSQAMLGYFVESCDVTSSTSCQQAAARSSARRAANKPGHRKPRAASPASQLPEGRTY